MDRQKKLTVATTNYEVSIWPLCMLVEMLSSDFHKLAGENYGGMKIQEWQNRTNRVAVDPTAHERITRLMLKKAGERPAWARGILKRIPRECRTLLAFTTGVARSDLTKKSNRELYGLYREYEKRFRQMYLYSWFPNSLEGPNNLLTKKLGDYLGRKLKALDKPEQASSYLSVLLTPTRLSTRQKEERDLLRLVGRIQSSRDAKRLFIRGTDTIVARLGVLDPVLRRAIRRHHRVYAWMPYNYDGPAWGIEYFLDRIRSLIIQKNSVDKLMSALEAERRGLMALQRRMPRELKLNEDTEYRFWIGLARQAMYLKDYRKDALFKSYFHMDRLIREIALRLYLSPIQVKHILPEEMEEILESGEVDAHQLNERLAYSVLVRDSTGHRLYTGEQARTVMKRYVKEIPTLHLSELRGEVAYFGKAHGEVCTVFTTADMAKMKPGDVLVSVATNPNLLPAMRLAGAIVTDRGGITSHAAVIARELKIPCVTGTKTATQVFKDGDLVEVDAEAGIVRRLG